jgi:uncharacterized protein (TIGR02266 family)
VRGIEVVLERPNGDRRLLELDATRVDDPAGVQIGAQLIARDLTERRALEEELDTQRRTLRMIFENVPAACILFERDGTISAANHLVERVLPTTAEQVIGRKATELFGGSARQPWPAARAFLSGKIEQDVVYGANRAGEPVYVHRTAGPVVSEGRVDKVVEILVDVTEQVERGDFRIQPAPMRAASPGKPAGAERRAWPRLPATFSAVLDHRGEASRVRVTNMSPGGLFLQTNKVIPTADELELRWTLPSGDADVHARGVVIWAKPKAGSAKAGVGVRLLHIVNVATR